MYENYYNFLEKPFNLTPDPKFFYMSQQHQGAMEHMLYGIKQREGFMTIVGDVGMGKTTLCRCLLDRLEKNIKVALILNPMLSDMDLLRTCVQDLGVKPLRPRMARPVMVPSGKEDELLSAQPKVTIAPAKVADSYWVSRATKKDLIDALNRFLLNQHKQGGSTVLIIDEAQNLSLEVMEQLRLLSNLETEKEKLLQIIFVGQLELNAKLQLPAMKQLNQRISVKYEISPLSREETQNYINHRVLVGGGGSSIKFSRSSLAEIYNYSRGYPRLINLVCDRALLAGYNAQVDTIASSHVKQAVRSLLGDDDKNYFFNRFLKNRLPLILSILFFLMGLTTFILSGKTPFYSGKDFPSAPSKTLQAPVSAPTPPVRRALPPLPLETPAPSMPVIEKQPQRDASAVAEEPEEVSIPARDDEVADAGNYRIQVFSLSAKSHAVQSVDQLKGKGFPAYWKQVETSGKVWYVVYLGPFKDRKSSVIYLNALKHSGVEPVLHAVKK